VLQSPERGPAKQPEEAEVRFMLSPTSFLITFCIGVAATLAWQSYGDVAREMIANSYPQLGWLAPKAEPVALNAPDTTAQATPPSDQQLLNAMSLDAVRQMVDRVAASQEQITRAVDRIAPSVDASQEQLTHSIDRIAASHEQMLRSIDRLTASQEQMMREITKLQEIEQYILYKNSESQPAAPARSRAPRPLQALTAPSPAANP
jgi:hypothetical protein